MPYKIRKQKCKKSTGEPGTHVLSYKDKKGKKHRACHSSKKKARGQIAAIEAESFKHFHDGVFNVMLYDHRAPGFFKHVNLSERHIIEFLGYELDTLREHKEDLSLHEQIYKEHLLFEGFLQSLSTGWSELKSHSKKAVEVAEMLSKVFNDNSALELAREQTLTLAIRSLKKIISNHHIVPSITEKLKQIASAAETKQGWRGMLMAIALMLLSEFIAKNDDAFTGEGMQRSIAKIIENLHNDIMSDSTANTVMSWLSRLGNIFMVGLSVINDVHRVLIRVTKIASGSGQPV